MRSEEFLSASLRNLLIQTIRTIMIAIGMDQSIFDANHPFSKTGDIRFVGDHYNRGPIRMKRLQDFHNFEACFRIQISSRFVSEDQGGMID